MIVHILAAILFFLPAGLANVAPIFANKIPWLKKWKTPLDFGKSWRGKRIFGNNKTWRGLISGVVVGGFTAYFEAITVFRINPSSTRLVAINIAGGMLLGFGALFGDAIESFFKRQASIAPGRSWFPFDQADYILGGLIVSFPFIDVAARTYLWVFVVWFGMHLIFSYIGYLLHLKDRPI